MIIIDTILYLKLCSKIINCVFEVKDEVNDCRDFKRFVTKSYTILAALQILNLTSVDDINKITDTMKKRERDKILGKVVIRHC